MLTDRARPAVKFCGLTRAVDADYAVELGAAYVGVIFAGGSRLVSEAQAAEVLANVPSDVGRVGVFSEQTPTEVARIARRLGLRAAQVHGATNPSVIADLRRATDVEVWPVIRVSGGTLPPGAAEIIANSETVLLDSFVPGKLGGSGVAFAWDELASAIQSLRLGKRLVLAGGLRPENLSQAITAIAPDVVDVSSGVESAPGIKDHERMRAFREAAMLASASR